MNIALSYSVVILILGLVLIFVIKDQLRSFVERIIGINYDKFKILLGQFEPRKETNSRLHKNEFFEAIYKKITGAQIHFLILLEKFHSKGMDQGMPCEYASQYFQNLVKSNTKRYDGWITPFFTSYLEENNLVSVSNNYYHLEELGKGFLDYLEKMGYSEKDKEF